MMIFTVDDEGKLVYEEGGYSGVDLDEDPFSEDYGRAVDSEGCLLSMDSDGHLLLESGLNLPLDAPFAPYEDSRYVHSSYPLMDGHAPALQRGNSWLMDASYHDLAQEGLGYLMDQIPDQVNGSGKRLTRKIAEEFLFQSAVGLIEPERTLSHLGAMLPADFYGSDEDRVD